MRNVSDFEGMDGRGDEFADTVEMRTVHADVEVRAQRLGEFLAQEHAQRPARNPTHNLADEVALGDGVVAASRTRLQPGRLGGEEFRHPIPVVPAMSGVDLVKTRQAGELLQVGELLLVSALVPSRVAAFAHLVHLCLALAS